MANPQPQDAPRADRLSGEFDARTHLIHCVMVLAEGPLKPAEIGRRAEKLAKLSGYPIRKGTFSSSTTGSHLRSMRDKSDRAFAEPTGDGRWRLTRRAWEQLGIEPPPE